MIGLNRALQIPEPFTFVSNASPRLFAYPPPIELKKAEAQKAVKHATLSVTAKAKAKANKKKEGDAAAMDIEEEKKEQDPKAAEEEAEKAKLEKAAADKAKALDEAKSEVLQNPARVTAGQFLLLTPSVGQRYKPVKPILAGCVMLSDSTPSEPEKLIASKHVAAALPGEALDEPAPFEYLGN